MLILCFVLVFIALNVAKKRGTVPPLRKLAAVEAIPELVGRCVETNRPVHWTAGYQARLDNAYAPALIASVGILSHLAGICAEQNARIICSVPQAELLPIVESVLLDAYKSKGLAFKRFDDIIYYPGEMGYNIGIINTFEREKVGGNVMVGHFVNEAIIIGETGVKIGAFQIGGTAWLSNLPFILATCDYLLMGEEVYTASAYLTKDIVQLGCIWGMDWVKWMSIILILLGTVLATAGVQKTWLSFLVY